MHMMFLGPDFIAPFMIFAIPIVAIVGGIAAGIVKMVGQQRLIELAQRERIAMIERGIDPSKLPPLPQMSAGHGWDDLTGPFTSPYEHSRRRSQGLVIGGLITLAVGVALSVMIGMLSNDTPNAWAVGLIPALVGIALLLSAWIVRPREADRGAGPPPRAS